MPDALDAKRDNLVQLYIPQDTTNVRHYFYQQENIPLYRQLCTKIVQGFHECAQNLDSLSECDDESDAES